MVKRMVIFGVLIIAFCSSAQGQSTAKDKLNSPTEHSDTNQVYLFADKMPEFSGGMDKYEEFILRNLTYPSNVMEYQGTVYITMIIDEEGNFLVDKVINAPDSIYAAEALRVIKLMPKWEPGFHKGKPVKVKTTVPVRFQRTANGNAKKDSVEMKDEGPVFEFLEKLPTYKGGKEAYTKFLSENLNYPMSAIERNIEGVVIISMVVDENGNHSEEAILEAPDSILGNEALRVIKLTPTWNPAESNGIPTKARATVKVNFNLYDREDRKRERKENRKRQ